MDENTTSERRCPACGASMPAEARFCGSCGMDTLPKEAPATVVAPAPAEPVAQAAQVMAAPASGTEQADEIVDGKPCNWCGAQNPQEATRCASCGATFPTPAGDEALERAARARIQSMESELKQPKRGGWWPFRQR